MPRPLRIKKQNIVYNIKTEAEHPQWAVYADEVQEVFSETFVRLQSLGYEFRVLRLEVGGRGYELEIIPMNRTPIDRLMQQINSMTARRLNKTLGNQGRFWKERYNSQLKSPTEDRDPKHCQIRKPQLEAI